MFRYRSSELEHLDKGDYTHEEYEDCLVELRRINRLLGDTRALRRSLFEDVRRSGPQAFSVLDVGAGSGELLRTIAREMKIEERRLLLVGLELNARSAKSILEESREYDEIFSLRGNALDLPFAANAFDYVICSLFTHHFEDRLVIAVIREMARVARRRVFVIDLHRHPVAYYFYTTVGRLFLHNRLIREDGALSILRSFRPAELHRLGAEAGLKELSVKRRFPFRLVLSGTKH